MRPENVKRCALAATILLAPGGFVLGAGLLVAWARRRRNDKRIDEAGASSSTEGKS